MRYFLGVAKVENIHKASEKLNVSTGSLSKAISRLEAELGVNLFTRERRNIRLTDQGRLLQKRAGEILRLEETARHEVAGHPGSLQVVIGGPEVLLANFGPKICDSIKRKYPTTFFELHACGEEEALEKVERGELHLAIVTREISNTDLSSKLLSEAKFQTYVGESHPLYSVAKGKKTVSVEQVLKHSFVSPNHSLLGKVGAKQSLDGWRDDQFPRAVEYLTSSLKTLEELVSKGKALAYLPNYFGENLPLEFLKITGCPYTCVQKIKMVAYRPKQTSWLNQLF